MGVQAVYRVACVCTEMGKPRAQLRGVCTEPGTRVVFESFDAKRQWEDDNWYNTIDAIMGPLPSSLFFFSSLLLSFFLLFLARFLSVEPALPPPTITTTAERQYGAADSQKAAAQTRRVHACVAEGGVNFG
eukprot:2070694-Rhodomonas_salina.2